MKNIIFFLLALSFGYAQNNNSEIFIKNELGLYGGVNFNNIPGMGSKFFFEGRKNVLSNVNLILSLGYSKILDLRLNNIKTYEYSKINNIENYNAVSYKITKTEYQVIPFSFGIQYYFNSTKYIPYIQSEISYNWLDTKTIKDSYKLVNSYKNYNSLPDEYKRKNILPISSLSFYFGLGLKYKLTTDYGIDIRYLFSIDNEIVNTHQVTIGIFL